MIVCQCRRLTERDVRAELARGARDLAELAEGCGAGSACGGCRATLEALLDEARTARLPARDDARRLAVVLA